MNKKTLLFIIFLSYSFLSNAQLDSKNTDLEEAFFNYFKLPRESIFLHLNKSSYIFGEDIWFKGYIYNRRTSSPFKESTNIHVGIYDSLGKLISKKLYLGIDGSAKGNITIDSTFTNGSYYIKASTNWMRNFNEDDAFVQKVKIYNKSLIRKQLSKTILNYDVQFLPEGGNLISGIQSTVGVKIINQNGYGVKIERGIILDEKDKEILEFNNSVLGLGKFNLIPRHEKKYRALITFKDGQKLSFPLPQIKKEGININVKETDKNHVVIILNTNKATKEKIKENEFFLLIHRDGLAKKIDVKFRENKTNAFYSLKKDKLHKGMNIITLIDKNEKPVLERLFFNTHGINPTDLRVSNINTKNDSLTIALKLFSKDSIPQNLSISVLPENTIAYNHNDNILSTFYLKPYIKGHIENPSFYFNNINIKKEQLDLLLLTQGWSRYDWNDIIKNPPKQTFKFERGITFSGIINSKLKSNDNIFLYSDQNSYPVIFNTIEEGNEFSIENYFPEKNEKIYFSLVKKNGAVFKPKIYLNSNKNIFTDQVKNVWKDNIIDVASKNIDFINLSNLLLEDKTIELNEVTVFEDKKNEIAYEETDARLLSRDKTTIIDEEIALSYPNVTDLLRDKGFTVIIPELLRDDLPVIIRRRGIRISFGDTVLPLIFVDNVRISDFRFLLSFPTNTIKSVYVDKSGASEGVRGAGGVIRIYTRKDKIILGSHNNKRNKAYEYVIKNGFEKTKEFYAPRYNTYASKAFENFGVIHWAPQIVTNKNGEAVFKILNTGLKDLSFFIEGMDSKGNLISTKKTINLN